MEGTMTMTEKVLNERPSIAHFENMFVGDQLLYKGVDFSRMCSIKSMAWNAGKRFGRKYSTRSDYDANETKVTRVE